MKDDVIVKKKEDGADFVAEWLNAAAPVVSQMEQLMILMSPLVFLLPVAHLYWKRVYLTFQPKVSSLLCNKKNLFFGIAPSSFLWFVLVAESVCGISPVRHAAVL